MLSAVPLELEITSIKFKVCVVQSPMPLGRFSIVRKKLDNIYSSDIKSEFCRESRKESEREGSEYNSQQLK